MHCDKHYMDDGNEKCPFVDSNVCTVTNTTWMMVMLCLPQEKCNSLESQELPEDAVETVAQELETKINAARKTEQTIMKKMADFVGKHFPVPDPVQVGCSLT